MGREGAKELHRGEPTEGPHGDIVGAGLVGSELPAKVGEREEAVGIIEALLVFPVAAFDLAVVSGSVGANQLVTDAEIGSGGFKGGQEITVGVGEAVGELEAVVGLDALDANTAPGEPGDGLSEEIGGGEGALLLTGAEASQACELVDGGVLEQAQVRVGDAAAWDDLHVDLYAFARCVICSYGLATYFFFFFAAGSMSRRCNTRYSE